MMHANHTWISAEEHLQCNARQAFLTQSAVHHAIAGTLETDKHTTSHSKSNSRPRKFIHYSTGVYTKTSEKK